MYSWTKLGRVVDPTVVANKPWWKEFAQAPATLDCGSFIRVYFSCRPPADAAGQYVSYSSYVDLDRSNLFRIVEVGEAPILPLGGLGDFDEFGVYPVSAVRVGGEVWAYYAGWTRCESVPFNVSIGLAKSTDGGRTFTRVGNGPVLSHAPDEPFIVGGPKIRRFGDQWTLFYIAGKKWKVVDGRPEPVYRLRMATSQDGLTWTRHGRDLVETRIEADEAQASPDVIFANGKYHLFFCYRHSAGYRSRERGYRIGYASSLDLRTWKRDDAMAGLDVSQDGWDSEMVSYPHLFTVDDQTYMAYLGNGVGRHGFGLARLNGAL